MGVTGDLGVLDEVVPFVEGRRCWRKAKTSRTGSRRSPTETATLYEHCARALDRSLKTGAHGLPLMGSGDWNDGMNRVGNQGRGESVWVGWFLHTTLSQFAPFCEARGETERGRAYREHVAKLKEALEAEAWDGDWYRRAYFDDGTPLGSAQNDECRIDSIAQSWARHLRRGRPAPRAARDGRRRRAPHPARRRTRHAVHAAVRPTARSTPVTSRATCRACARTAGSTRTPPSGC